MRPLVAGLAKSSEAIQANPALLADIACIALNSLIGAQCTNRWRKERRCKTGSYVEKLSGEPS